MCSVLKQASTGRVGSSVGDLFHMFLHGAKLDVYPDKLVLLLPQDFVPVALVEFHPRHGRHELRSVWEGDEKVIWCVRRGLVDVRESLIERHCRVHAGYTHPMLLKEVKRCRSKARKGDGEGRGGEYRPNQSALALTRAHSGPEEGNISGREIHNIVPHARAGSGGGGGGGRMGAKEDDRKKKKEQKRAMEKAANPKGSV